MMNKKKIALVADVQNWAFDIAAKIMQNNLSDNFEIDIFYSKPNGIKRDFFDLLEELQDYDIIHFFWRGILLNFEQEEFKQKVIAKYGDYSKYLKKYTKKISTGIYDHLFENDMNFNKTFTKYCSSYVVSSEKLFKIYNNMNYIKKPACVMGDTFEKKLFYPDNMERFNTVQNIDIPLIIGWVGNPEWNSISKDANGNLIDFKGFHTILNPVIHELKNNGYNIELVCANKSTNYISFDKMCKYYSNIHIYVCVSNKEGTPKPLLEAMGCAVPIITTDVGIVNEALGSKQKDYILGERIIGNNDTVIKNTLKDKIKCLYNNRHILSELSAENYDISKHLEIAEVKKIYRKYFKDFSN